MISLDNASTAITALAHSIVDRMLADDPSVTVGTVCDTVKALLGAEVAPAVIVTRMLAARSAATVPTVPTVPDTQAAPTPTKPLGKRALRKAKQAAEAEAEASRIAAALISPSNGQALAPAQLDSKRDGQHNGHMRPSIGQTADALASKALRMAQLEAEIFPRVCDAVKAYEQSGAKATAETEVLNYFGKGPYASEGIDQPVYRVKYGTERQAVAVVWDVSQEDTPTAKKTLDACVSRMRRLLGDGYDVAGIEKPTTKGKQRGRPKVSDLDKAIAQAKTFVDKASESEIHAFLSAVTAACQVKVSNTTKVVQPAVAPTVPVVHVPTVTPTVTPTARVNGAATDPHNNNELRAYLLSLLAR